MAETRRGARGESILRDGEREVRVLFTNRALAEAEQALGRSVLAVAQGFTTGAAGVGDVAHLLAAGMEAARRDGREGGRAVSIYDAYAVMDAVGFAEAARAVMEAVGAVLAYRHDDAEPAATDGGPEGGPEGGQGDDPKERRSTGTR